MSRGRRGFALALPALLLAGTPRAARALVFGPRDGVLGFSVGVLGLFGATGRFETFRAAREGGRLLIEAEAASLRLSSPSHEERVRGPAWFDAARFPVMRFEGADVLREGETVPVPGTLTLRGRVLPVTGTALVRAAAGGVALDARTEISRAAFGMEADAPLVGDQVVLALSVRRQIQ
ncbi:MAG: YceI family protein [Acetobacteraceae bacterium]|nr:YceI family protein [Acetobacteraceae bacterium]